MVLERDSWFSRDILSLKSQSVLPKGGRRESSFQISRAQLIKLEKIKDHRRQCCIIAPSTGGYSLI